MSNRNASLIVQIGGRDALPVRAIPFVTEWALSPDEVALHLARRPMGGYPFEQLRNTSAYHLHLDSPLEMRPKEWERIAVQVDALSHQLKTKFPDDDQGNIDATGCGDWELCSVEKLPSGAFVWLDEFEKDFNQTLHGLLDKKGEEIFDGRHLNFTPKLPSNEVRKMVREGFEIVDPVVVPETGAPPVSPAAVMLGASEFESLFDLIKNHAGKPFYELPESLRQRVSEEFSPFTWTECKPEGRIQLAQQSDLQNNPAYQLKYKRASELYDELGIWEGMNHQNDPIKFQMIEAKLSSLRAELAGIDDVSVSSGAALHAVPLSLTAHEAAPALAVNTARLTPEGGLMTPIYYSPMFSRLVQKTTTWQGGRMAGSDVLTLADAASMASKHAKTEITQNDILRAAGRGEIPLRAIVRRTAKTEPCWINDIPLNEGKPVPEGSIPTLPLTACQALSNTGRASWRTFDGHKMKDGVLCWYIGWKLADDEPDFVTVPDDCRLTGWDVHALADAFLDMPPVSTAAAPMPIETQAAPANDPILQPQSEGSIKSQLWALADARANEIRKDSDVSLNAVCADICRPAISKTNKSLMHGQKGWHTASWLKEKGRLQGWKDPKSR